jgi:hypothetical protein
MKETTRRIRDGGTSRVVYLSPLLGPDAEESPGQNPRPVLLPAMWADES